MKTATTTSSDLGELATLHASAFPDSFSTRLGKPFLIRSFQWYLADSRCFLFHLRNRENTMVGYCGGMESVPGQPGSTSSMIQFAFHEALRGIVIRPWLLLHPELRANWPLVVRNLARRLRLNPSRSNRPSDITAPPLPTPQKRIGLVVIGVSPQNRKQGLGQHLLQEFERRARERNAHEVYLTVREENLQARKAYEKSGWKVNSVRSPQVTYAKAL